MRRPAHAVLLPAVLVGLAGCGLGAQSPADRTKACTAVAAVVATAGVGATPTQQDALAAADRLDPLLPSLRDVTAHDAAVRLHAQLHAYEQALRRSSGKEGTALTKSREAIADLARACQLPTSAFLGNPSPTS